jgi:hypothetical protein
MRRLAAFTVIAAALAGCSEPVSESGTVVLDEYTIDLSGSVFTGDAVSLAVENAGEFAHTLVVTRRDGSAVAATATVPPGSTAELVLDLEPGKYQVSCRIVVQLADGTIIDHYEQGMVASLRVEGP